MEYTIVGNIMPLVQVTLGAGERIRSQAGAMKWMDPSIEMQTQMAGGMGGFVKRKMMGESGFLNSFSAREAGARVAFGHTYPGKILPLQIEQQPIICQKRSFLAAQESVQLDIKFQQRLGVGFFGGEGFIMQKLHGSGMAFVELDGEMIETELGSGQQIRVETGAVAMFEEGVQMAIERVKGVKNMLFGGEGLFLTTLTGPGRIWLQTMSIQSLARELSPFLPKRSSSN